MWVMLGLPVMLGVSMLSRKWALRRALSGTLLFMLLLALVPYIGKEANGAHRWIGAGSFLIQPSAFLTQLFLVTTPWLLHPGPQIRTLPANPLSHALSAIIVVHLLPHTHHTHPPPYPS